ncbi:MAG: Mth938-like domain-containing protein [Rhodocyclaceae bacterium]
MKFQLDSSEGRNAVTAYGEGFVEVSRKRYETSLVLLPDRIVTDWGEGGFDALTLADIERLRMFQPQVLLLGTGSRQRFPPPSLLRPLIEARIGYEIMTLPAACRTFNVLIAEGRHVLAALLLD